MYYYTQRYLFRTVGGAAEHNIILCRVFIIARAFLLYILNYIRFDQRDRRRRAYTDTGTSHTFCTVCEPMHYVYQPMRQRWKEFCARSEKKKKKTTLSKKKKKIESSTACSEMSRTDKIWLYRIVDLQQPSAVRIPRPREANEGRST
jgi:hypothetical protein